MKLKQKYVAALIAVSQASALVPQVLKKMKRKERLCILDQPIDLPENEDNKSDISNQYTIDMSGGLCI